MRYGAIGTPSRKDRRHSSSSITVERRPVMPFGGPSRYCERSSSGAPAAATPLLASMTFGTDLSAIEWRTGMRRVCRSIVFFSHYVPMLVIRRSPIRIGTLRQRRNSWPSQHSASPAPGTCYHDYQSAAILSRASAEVLYTATDTTAAGQSAYCGGLSCQLPALNRLCSSQASQIPQLHDDRRFWYTKKPGISQ